MEIKFPPANTSPISVAAALAPFAEAAYPTSSEAILAVTAFVEKTGAVFWRWKYKNATGIAVLVDGVLIIGVAGTNDLEDARDDTDVSNQTLNSMARIHGWGASTGRTPTTGERVHRGVAIYASKACEGLHLAKIHETDPHKIYIVGHSLGGAAAEIMPGLPAWLEHANVVSYGAQKNYSKKSLIINRGIIAVMATNDLTPLVPMIFFRHPFRYELYLANGSVVDSMSWLDRVKRVIYYCGIRVRLIDAVKHAHSMRNYRKRLEA